MANPVGTFATYQQIGIREDLTEMIYRISPTETPCMNMFARETARQTKHEWQIDKIPAAVATNQAFEGNNPTNTTVNPTSRIFNYCEIPQYAFQVSGTAQAVNPAGRANELAFQLVKYGLQMKRDMESAISQNNGFVAGATGTARVSASLESWLSSNNTTLGSGGSPATVGFSTGNGTSAPVDNSAVATVTEAAVKAIIRAAWNAGGNPDTILVGPYNKVKVSGFSGILTNNIFQQATGKQARIVGAADAYVSDFGELAVVPSRFNRDRTVCILDLNYWALAYLRPFQSVQLAVTGDSIQRMILAEYTLVSRNEAASGKVTDLATS